MTTCPTVQIVASDPDQGAFVVINEEDFDQDVHTLYAEPGAEPEAGPEGLTKTEIIADLEAMGVDYNPRAPKASLLALRNDARAIRDAKE